MNETETQIRLRRSKEALAAARDAEAAARRILADSIESTKRAKDRYDELFAAEESAECARRRKEYMHATK
jgi:hypothetical protein